MVLTETLRSIARPVVAQRRRLERWRYRGSVILDAEAGNRLLSDRIKAGTPTAVGKIGESELRGLRFFLANRGEHGACESMRGLSRRIFVNAGVFPESIAALNAFGNEFTRALSQIDVLAVWYQWGECETVRRTARQATLIELQALDSYFLRSSWTAALSGRTVLVVSPFASTIAEQAKRLRDVWRLLPAVSFEADVRVLKTPLSHALVPATDASWQAALDRLRNQMSGITFDVSLIGAGAWSLPLACHAKAMGRIGIHMGGGTQVLFGVRGRRWDERSDFRAVMTEAWVRPKAEETPQCVNLIERGCYW